MADEESPGTEATKNLTERQKKVLADALTEVQLQVFQHTVKRLRVYLAILVAVIGLESFFLGWGMRKDIVDVAAVALARDVALREDMVKSASERIDKAVKHIEDQGAARVADLGRSLDEANKMLDMATRGSHVEQTGKAAATRAPK